VVVQCLQDVVVEATHDVVFPALDRLEIHGHVARLDADVVPVLDVLLEAGGVDERLRRNTAVVDADATDRLPLDQCNVQPPLGAPKRRRVAARTGPDHDEICRECPACVTHKTYNISRHITIWDATPRRSVTITDPSLGR